MFEFRVAATYAIPLAMSNTAALAAISHSPKCDLGRGLALGRFLAVKAGGARLMGSCGASLATGGKMEWASLGRGAASAGRKPAS